MDKFPQPESIDTRMDLGGDMVCATGWPINCITCRSVCMWYSINFMSPVCSFYCLQRLWDNWASRQTGGRSEAVSRGN